LYDGSVEAAKTAEDGRFNQKPVGHPDIIATQWGIKIKYTLFYDDLVSPRKSASAKKWESASATKTRAKLAAKTIGVLEERVDHDIALSSGRSRKEPRLTGRRGVQLIPPFPFPCISSFTIHFQTNTTCPKSIHIS
jgi:hypothetical protein